MSNNPKKYIAELPSLTESGLEDLPKGSFSGLENTEEGKAEAYVNNKSLLSFVAEVSGQLREDVLNSTLLAQRVADHFYNKPDNQGEWYKKYFEVLSNIGWSVEVTDYVKYETNENLFEMESAVIGILTSLVGQDYIGMVKGTLDAIKGLADGDDIIKLFESSTQVYSKSNFQIGTVVQKNETVSMGLGSFLLTSATVDRRVLFFRGTRDSFNLEYNTLKSTLTEESYNDARGLVQEKLGQSTKKYIAKLPDFNIV